MKSVIQPQLHHYHFNLIKMMVVKLKGVVGWLHLDIRKSTPCFSIKWTRSGTVPPIPKQMMLYRQVHTTNSARNVKHWVERAWEWLAISNMKRWVKGDRERKQEAFHVTVTHCLITLAQKFRLNRYYIHFLYRVSEAKSMTGPLKEHVAEINKALNERGIYALQHIYPIFNFNTYVRCRLSWYNNSKNTCQVTIITNFYYEPSFQWKNIPPSSWHTNSNKTQKVAASLHNVPPLQTAQTPLNIFNWIPSNSTWWEWTNLKAGLQAERSKSSTFNSYDVKVDIRVCDHDVTWKVEQMKFPIHLQKDIRIGHPVHHVSTVTFTAFWH